MWGRLWPAGALLVPLVPLATAGPGVLTAMTATHPARVATRIAPGCAAVAQPAGTRITAVPWAQERYPPHRLAALADGRDILVAVIDSGVDAGHPQLSASVVPGRDLLDGGPGTADCASHGTAVASIIAARPAPGVGFQGLAPRARILPVRVSEQQDLDGGAAGRAVPATGLAEAIRYAVSRGADVINLSLVIYRDDPQVRAAVAHALQTDVVVVAAVGNRHDRGDPTPYPAGYAGVLGVGAVSPGGSRVPSSQVGSYVDIVAPGAQVTAAARVSGHATYEGTSFATAFVSATAALVRQYWPGEPAGAVVRRIIATADPAPGGRGSTEYGHGVLNPYRALAERLAAGESDGVAAPPAPGADPTAPAAHAERAAVAERAREKRLAMRVASLAGLATLLTLAVAAVGRHSRRPRAGPP